MKIVCLSFTQRGAGLCSKLVGLLNQDNENICDGYAIKRYCSYENLMALESLSHEVTKSLFETYQALVYIGATGIAVRKIAPFLISKSVDPAVICIDEKGLFVIPLISGHMGGANKLADKLAGLLQATPVITTATDVNHKLAIDTWAVENNFSIVNVDMIKHISAAILDDQEVGLYCDIPQNISYPKELSENVNAAHGVCISFDPNKKPFHYTLNLVPQAVTVGLGCRKNIAFELVEDLFLTTLKKYNLSLQEISCMASIDIKKDEPAFIQLSRKYKIDFVTYSAAELDLAEGQFQASAFVKTTTGVDNVCERAGFLASHGGEQVCQKTCANGVTISLFRSVHHGKPKQVHP